jgi:hypothetical protein
MDGWMDGWTDGRKDGRTVRQTGREIGRQACRQTVISIRSNSVAVINSTFCDNLWIKQKKPLKTIYRVTSFVYVSGIKRQQYRNRAGHPNRRVCQSKH